MSGILLERARGLLEAAEVNEQAIVSELNVKPNGQKAKVVQQQTLYSLIESTAKDNKELMSLLENDSSLKSEIRDMKGSGMFDSFYTAVASTREYYARFPSLNEAPGAPVAPTADVSVAFAGEEVFGKYLDLHSFHLQYTNLPNVPSREQDYLQYLDKFNTFFFISDATKNSKQYRVYVSELWEYLLDFFSRIQPLVDRNSLVSGWRSEFEKKWADGEVPGWKKKDNSDPQALRLGMFNSVEELEALGLDRLKQALEALGLKCGGTLKDRAQRLWSVRGKKTEDIPHKLKAVRPAQNGDAAKFPGSDQRMEVLFLLFLCACCLSLSSLQLAWAEYCIQSMCETIADIVSATRRHAEKQQSRTVEEKEAEILEEEYGHALEENPADETPDDDEPFYNPLNLPLGWDGKPIPFWLYKLHGLGVEYRCEVCGNQSYWGRRAFDKHFQEWRHAHGMRCLGVPNTKHFHDITLIEDVLALYNKIKGTIQTDQEVLAEEEFEDTEGNVLNRRTYEDLARQGLL